jgi:hypothetical protein
MGRHYEYLRILDVLGEKQCRAVRSDFAPGMQVCLLLSMLNFTRRVKALF